MSRDDWTGSEVTGRQTGNRYLVTSRLAEGGMAIAYRGRGPDGVEVVVKTPLPAFLGNRQFLGRFEREVRTVSAVSHPNVVRLLDSGVANGVPFLVVPYYGGGTLADRERRAGTSSGPLPAAGIPAWLSPVAAAVDYLHQRNLLHRDLKPENIFFDATGQPVVADFGIVKVAADIPELLTTVYTLPGSTLGTPAYMAPELIMGRAVDGRIDIYALGVMAYEWLTGRVPFEGTNPAAILVKQFGAAQSLIDPSDHVPAIPRELSAIVLKAMAVNPAERYPRATAFATALEDVIRATAPPPAPSRAKNRAESGSEPIQVARLVSDPTPKPPVASSPSVLPADPSHRLPAFTAAPVLVLFLAHLLVGWLVLLGGLTNLDPTPDEVTVGKAVLRVADRSGGLAPQTDGITSWGDAAGLILCPLAFVAGAGLCWLGRPSAKVVGLLLAAAVGWAVVSRLGTGFAVSRPVLVGAWGITPWIGLPYAVGVWVMSFSPRFRAALLPAAPPPPVTVLASVCVLIGAGLAVGALTALVARGGVFSSLQWVALVLLTAVAIALIPAGFGLARRREWARLLVLALSGTLAVFVIGIAFFVPAAVVLLRPAATAEFRSTRLFPPASSP